MKRTCFLCGDDAAKGSHYLTLKTPDRTTRNAFAVCEPCGEGLADATAIFFDEFIKAWRAALEAERE